MHTHTDSDRISKKTHPLSTSAQVVEEIWWWRAVHLTVLTIQMLTRPMWSACGPSEAHQGTVSSSHLCQSIWILHLGNISVMKYCKTQGSLDSFSLELSTVSHNLLQQVELAQVSQRDRSDGIPLSLFRYDLWCQMSTPPLIFLQPIRRLLTDDLWPLTSVSVCWSAGLLFTDRWCCLFSVCRLFQLLLLLNYR